MSIRNLILGLDSFTVSCLTIYDSLLKNAIDIIRKCDSYFITKCNRRLLQNVSGFVLQSATIYYKMWQLLQIATVQSPIKVERKTVNIILC